MRTKLLSLIGALALCVMALAGGTAQAACGSNFCVQAEQECFGGCPCAVYFKCNPGNCTYICSCPIFC